MWLKTVKSLDEIEAIKKISLKVNEVFLELFFRAGIDVVDFKLEFGRDGKSLILADELSPDNFRLWDKSTGKKLDKDRFRHNLGAVEEAYKEVLSRLKEV